MAHGLSKWRALPGTLSASGSHGGALYGSPGIVIRERAGSLSRAASKRRRSGARSNAWFQPGQHSRATKQSAGAPSTAQTASGSLNSRVMTPSVDTAAMVQTENGEVRKAHGYSEDKVPIGDRRRRPDYRTRSGASPIAMSLRPRRTCPGTVIAATVGSSPFRRVDQTGVNKP